MPEQIHTIEEIAGKALLTADTPGQNVPVLVPDEVARTKKKHARPDNVVSKKRLAQVRALEDECRQMALSLFFHTSAPARSIGFTSAIDGEGKSFLSALMARSIAEVSPIPVTLLECNWRHPSLHSSYHLPAQPGLAEWLRGECDLAAIRHRIYPNLTVIPAGDSRQDALRFLHQIRQKGLVDTSGGVRELYIVDLPALQTSHYGVAAASIVDALFVVVRAGATPESMVRQACAQLEDLPLRGLVLNQVKSSIPRWIRQLL